MEKECRRCRRICPESDFGPSKKSRDGLDYWCRGCKKEWQRDAARRAGTPEKRLRDASLLPRGLKECFRCDRTLALTEFTAAKMGYGGVAAYCKPCMSAYQIERRARDPERYHALLHSYRQSDKHKSYHRSSQQKRKARKRSADTGQVTTAFMRDLYECVLCAYCGRETPRAQRTVDHVVPLAVGGLHEPQNLVMACGACNSRKQAVSAVQFREQLDAEQNQRGGDP